MNGVCFDLDHGDFDDVYTNGTSNGGLDPAFRKVQKNHSAFLIWRIENSIVIAVPTEKYSTFNDTDSYIVFAATQYGQPSGPNSIQRELKGGAEYHIHFWLGKATSTEKAGVAAYKTVELDSFLGGNSTQHREVQGSESPRFKSYFNKTGMKIMSGVSSPTIRHTIEGFDPALYRVKGKRAPIVTQMPSIAWVHFTSGDVFLLHTPVNIFVWVGRAANHTEKLHATKAAMSLKLESKTPNVVFVDDGYEKTLFDDDLKEMEIYLPLNKRHVRPADEDIEEENSEKKSNHSIKLYQCSDTSGKYRVTEIKSGPIKQSDLISEDVFILDHGLLGIWVWVGKRASDKERTEAMRNARGFVKKKKYPSHTAVTRVVEGSEPFEFKLLFAGWEEKPETIGLVKGIAKPVTVFKVTKYDAETMYDRPALAAKSQLIDDGSGTVRKWMVKKGQILELPKERNAVFFSSDCYIVMYNYKAPTGDKIVLFYWLGLNSIQDEQGTSLMKCLEMDFEAGLKTVLARVVQGREPPHFLQIFKGKMRTFLGKGLDFDASGKNMKTPNHYLLQVAGSSSYNSKATQVPLNASSLNSNNCFVLRKGSHYYVWCGSYSNGDNREIAKAFAGTEFALILEGNESPECWHAIGGKGEYVTTKIPEVKQELIHPRLYQCTAASGVFKSEEIFGFTQQDLTPETVMLLDAKNVIFLWNGSLCNKEERHMSLHTAIEYLKADPGDRDKYTCITQVKQGFEPPTFTGFFENWDPHLWKDYKTYFDLRGDIEKDNVNYATRKSYVTPKIPDEFDQFPKYPISVLTGPNETLPASVDPLKKEVNLTYDDFISLTKMTYTDFKNLPFWKQQEIKKKVGLF